MDFETEINDISEIAITVDNKEITIETKKDIITITFDSFFDIQKFVRIMVEKMNSKSYDLIGQIDKLTEEGKQLLE